MELTVSKDEAEADEDFVGVEAADAVGGALDIVRREPVPSAVVDQWPGNACGTAINCLLAEEQA